MIVLFTDFGEVGPYTGQIKAVLAREAPGVDVVDLLHDAPAFQARPSSYLLATLIDVFPTETVFICVIDPGVGGDRAAIVVEADGRWFVGPDNGLFEIVMRRANDVMAWNITWRPDSLSASFHGRDLFAQSDEPGIGGFVGITTRLVRMRATPGDTTTRIRCHTRVSNKRNQSCQLER